jgi:hypothetical protein
MLKDLNVKVGNAIRIKSRKFKSEEAVNLTKPRRITKNGNLEYLNV